MKLRIVVEKVIVRGEKRFRIIRLEGKKWADLPTSYTSLKDSVRLGDGVILGKRGLFEVDEGDALTLKEMKSLEEVCGVAADLLKKTNKELREKNRGWKGKTTFEF